MLLNNYVQQKSANFSRTTLAVQGTMAINTPWSGTSWKCCAARRNTLPTPQRKHLGFEWRLLGGEMSEELACHILPQAALRKLLRWTANSSTEAEFIYFPHCVSQLYFALRKEYNYTHWQADKTAVPIFFGFCGRKVFFSFQTCS